MGQIWAQFLREYFKILEIVLIHFLNKKTDTTIIRLPSCWEGASYILCKY